MLTRLLVIFGRLLTPRELVNISRWSVHGKVPLDMAGLMAWFKKRKGHSDLNVSLGI